MCNNNTTFELNIYNYNLFILIISIGYFTVGDSIIALLLVWQRFSIFLKAIQATVEHARQYDTLYPGSLTPIS